jgi:predicted lipoprotein with Yx(FWY)xxD motif
MSKPHPHITMLAVTVAATAASLAGVATTASASPVHHQRTATLHTAKASVGGVNETILVNAKGLPLYFYQPDTARRSLVTGQLAALWPPLVARVPSANGARGTLRAVDTANGHQVSYNGHFLYTFVDDSPGQVTGQGVQDFFVATPAISASHAASTGHASTVRAGTATSSGSSHGW